MNRRLAFIFFFVSGFVGLLYQVVWLRLAQAHFGVITPVLSVVLSVFMLGLAAGSWASGRWVTAGGRFSKIQPLVLYAGAESVIGMGGLLIPVLYAWGEALLLSAGDVNGGLYLLLSALFIAVSTLPWCFAMGATTPLMLAHLKRTAGEESTSGFSFLYLANTVGAIAGTLITGWVLIEFLGFQATLWLGVLFNGAIAAAAFAFAPRGKAAPAAAPLAEPARTGENKALLWALFTSGFVSMSLEVLFVRMFTPIVGTTTYAFSLVLAYYLASISLGAAWHRRQLRAGRQSNISLLLVLSAAACATPILFNSPSLKLGLWCLPLAIVPFFTLTGLLTPRLVDTLSGGDPVKAGRAYAVNAIGCILGPLVAGYFLLPMGGARIGLAAMGALMLGVGILTELIPTKKRWDAGAMLVFICAMMIFGRTREDGYPGSVVRRDTTATVVSGGHGRGKMLHVNGIGMTALVITTKIMAHLPLVHLNRPPERALVICFGMGTTFRSLSSWDIAVTAVELVPSVAAAFPFYYDDAEEVRVKPGRRIVIDDGRRFLQRTKETFDVIAIDPPPPPSAAGSSLLYSVEFYALAKRRLADDGILQQWIPWGDAATMASVRNALTASFPHVRAYSDRPSGSWGWYYLASNRPIVDPTAAQIEARMPAAAEADLTEDDSKKTAAQILMAIQASAIDVAPIPAALPLVLTDDRPFNEYFWARSAAAAHREWREARRMKDDVKAKRAFRRMFALQR